MRLISSDGSPSVDGEGRLEMLVSNTWSPICNEGFSDGSEVVACKQMGFSGAAALQTRPSCRTFHGRNSCGTKEPRVSELACSGQEADLLGCQFKSNDDVFCAPEVRMSSVFILSFSLQFRCRSLRFLVAAIRAYFSFGFYLGQSSRKPSHPARTEN